MCVDAAKMKFIRKNDPAERAEMLVECMRVGTADGDRAILFEQVIPFAQRGDLRSVRDHLWKKGVKNAVQPGGDDRLEFAQPVPEFDARKIFDRPVHP